VSATRLSPSALGGSAAGGDADLYRSLIDAIDEGYAVIEVIFDDDGKPTDYRFIDTNATFDRQTGLTKAVGRTARELVPDLEAFWFEVYGKVAATGEPMRFRRRSVPLERWFDVYAFRLACLPPRQIAILFRDVTEAHNMEMRLRDSEIRYRSALRVGRIGAWETDFVNKVRIWSEEGMRLFGINLPEGRGQVGGPGDEWLALIHPDDAEMPGQIYETLRTSDRIHARYRVRRPDGTEISILAHGEVATRNENGEVARLISVVADITELSRAEERIRESEARLASALAAGELGVHDYDPITGKLSWDNTVRRLWGVEDDAPITYETFASGVHPADLPAVEAAVARALDPSGPGRFNIEYRVIHRRTGEERWLVANGDATFENGVAIRLVGTVRDIHERKQGEAHREMLLQELNHRVKNTLATVKAIASQTLKGDGATPAARAAFDGRLMALASAHELLIRKDWADASLHDIIQRALAPHVGADTTRIEVRGPHASLSASSSLALTMCLHELATNAAKYGALSVEEGRVTVSWILRGTLLALEWRENGGPPVSKPQRRGFGSQLIERSLASDLNGSAEIEFATSGVICRVTATVKQPHGAQGDSF
jgi:PAS domain S-box-containing protein